MATQFLYPTGDFITNDFTNQDNELPLYTSINQGVDTPVDSSYVFSTGINQSFTVNVGPMFVYHPTGIYINVRHSGEVNHDLEVNFKDNNGLNINNTSDLQINTTSSVFSKYSVTDSINEGNRDAFDFLDTRLEVSVLNNGSGEPQISEAEVVVLGSGNSSFNTSAFNLFVDGDDFAIRSSGKFDLFTFGANVGTTGIYSHRTLFVGGRELERTGIMNLFIDGLNQPIADTKTMNLFLKSFGDVDGFQQHSDNITLYVENNVDKSSGVIPLVIWNQKEGSTSGAIPSSGFMNLFISRSQESTSHILPLYAAGPSGETSQMTLFMQGLPNTRNDIDMFIFGIGKTSDNLQLYTHGF